MRQTGRPSLASRLGGPHTALLIALLVAFAVYPILGETQWARTLLTIALTFMMASALFAVHSHRRVFIIGLILAVGAVAAMVLGHAFRLETARPIATGLEFMFMVVLAASIFSNVLRAKEVTMDTVFGASCVYLMLGMIWGGIYELVETFEPGSFNLGGLQSDGAGPETDSSASKLMYYSFITMTTVGYGDVTPLSPAARAFAALHGLVGQLYIAIIVARLVGLEVAHRMQGGTRERK